jgi:hypothetical protein
LNYFLDGRKDSAKYNKIRVSIGDEYERWTALATCLPHHPFSVIQAVRIDFFVYFKSCQYSMFYTNKMF